MPDAAAAAMQVAAAAPSARAAASCGDPSCGVDHSHAGHDHAGHDHGHGHGHKEKAACTDASHDHGHSGNGHGHAAAPAVPAMPDPVTGAWLEAKLLAALPGTVHVSATDESDGCGSKFNVVVASAAFEGVRREQKYDIGGGSLCTRAPLSPCPRCFSARWFTASPAG